MLHAADKYLYGVQLTSSENHSNRSIASSPQVPFCLGRLEQDSRRRRQKVTQCQGKTASHGGIKHCQAHDQNLGFFLSKLAPNGEQKDKERSTNPVPTMRIRTGQGTPGHRCAVSWVCNRSDRDWGLP